MIFRLFRRPPEDDSIARLYGTIVAQARAPAFYTGYGVPDTVNGRFEMIVLHLVLILLRLDREPASGRDLGQKVFDLFCQDIDANMREMGVGDLAVPKKMRRVAAAFYARQAAYKGPLVTGDRRALEAALGANLLGIAQGCTTGAGRLAAYVEGAARYLAMQESGDLGRGEVSFPDPKAGPAADQA